MRPILLIALLVLVVASLASGQTVTFTASADHATIDRYVLGWFAAGATAPQIEVDLGKPCTADLTVPCSKLLDAKPLAFGTYTVKVRAVAGAVTSIWSDPSNTWTRLPLPPGAPAVK
jgi:hypothetical protein